MNREEVCQILNIYKTMYPNQFRGTENPKGKDLQIMVYQKQFANYEYIDVENALYKYQAKTENNYSPPMGTLLSLAENEKTARLKNIGRVYRRIITPEEDCRNQFKELMAKGKYMTNEDVELAKKLMPYAELFEGEGWEERYRRHFGMSREEFEYYD